MYVRGRRVVKICVREKHVGEEDGDATVDVRKRAFLRHEKRRDETRKAHGEHACSVREEEEEFCVHMRV